MSEEKDNLKSIKVYKFNNTKENWHEFALKFRVIADTRGYWEIINGTMVPPDEQITIAVTTEDKGEALKEKKRSKTHQKKKQHGRGDSKGKGHLDMSKIKCFNCGEYGHFARDCLKARDNASIAQESEKKGKLESMLDLDSTSVSEECAMVCTELQYEDASEDEVVYGDQGTNTEEYEKATYGDLTKAQSKEEDNVKCTVAQRANDSMILERNRRRLSENDPNKISEDYNQSDAPINKMSTVNSINESMLEVQDPMDDNNKNESRKAWTMEMLMNGSDISANMTNE